MCYYRNVCNHRPDNTPLSENSPSWKTGNYNLTAPLWRNFRVQKSYWCPFTLRGVKTLNTTVWIPMAVKTWKPLYEGESNGNLKSAMKTRNTARLSCKLATMIHMVLRVADRWQYDAGMQHDGAVVVWRWRPCLQHAPKKNSVLSSVFK